MGKSTQIGLLKNSLKSRRIKVVETYIKSTHGLAYILSKFLIVLSGSEKAIFPDGNTQLYPRKELMKRLFTLWRFLDAFSIITKFFFTVYLPFCLGFTPLVEEGLMMTIFTYRRSFPVLFQLESKSPPVIPVLLGWVMSKNNVNFVFDATDDELEQRRRKREFRRSELSMYVTLQRRWMKRLNDGNTFFVDTTRKTADQVHRNIVIALDTHKSAL